MASKETLYVSFIDSRFGLIGIASSGKGPVRLTFPLRSEASFRRRLGGEYPGSVLEEGRKRNEEAARQISSYLEGSLREFDLRLDLRAPLQQS